MPGVLLFLFILAVIAGIAAPIIYFQVRKTFREQKNFERGLKMVPLLIHLPPSSDDIEGNGRDVRDVVDENISKAQIIYNIISSTLQKGGKTKFYGQRHFAFEIVGTKGFVHFYAAVPVALVEIVKQAVISAYPSARLEEVSEHNIFSPVGKISGTIGGELTLKEHYAYPIATYQDLKRDAMQSLLNSLSSLDKEDGVGIQILMRPADPGWRKVASEVASKKRKGKDTKKGAALAGGLLKDLAVAVAKPPESKDDKPGGDKPELSNAEQAILDAIDLKTQSPGFEVLIRVVASSNISQRAQAILTNVTSAFSLYDAPGKNGFKYTPAKDIEQFVTAYIMRFFPQENRSNILNATELATLFHFPDQKNIPTSQLQRQQSKQVDGPRNMPDEGLLLGYNVFHGVKKPIRLNLSDRQRHMYAVGQTGTGKSTFLENLAYQDMLNGEGFCFIDPHGDTADKLMSMVPPERVEDIVYFCPADMDRPMGLNLFEHEMPEQRDFLIQEAINMLYKLYDPQHQGIIGPRYEHWFRNAALTVMANPEGGTFIDIPKVFTDNNYAKDLLKYVDDKTVLDFWNKEMASTSDYHKSEVLGWFVSKFGAFLSNEMMRNIIGQTKSAFNLREIMDNKKILIVNLSKGKTGDLNSKLLGMIFVMQFQAAAMSRANIPESDRVDFCLYVDEFQNFSTESFATIMSEARKYHLNLIVANQFTTQLTEEIRDAVFGNMGTIVAFRIGQNDVDSLTRYFQPLFDGDDLLRIPNANTVVRTLIGGVPTQPFSMATLAPLGNPNPQVGPALKQFSAAKYGRPKKEVSDEIFARLETKEQPKPPGGAAGNPFGGAGKPMPGQAKPGAAARPGAPGSASFLDEWLAKKRITATKAGTPAAAAMPQPAQNPFSAQSPLQSPSAQASTVTMPPAPSVTASTPPPTNVTQNISSNDLQMQEVNTIAQQIKGGLHQQPVAPTQSQPNPVLQPVQMQPQSATPSAQAPVQQQPLPPMQEPVTTTGPTLVPATPVPTPVPQAEPAKHRTEVEVTLQHEDANSSQDTLHIQRD